jgi:hypothetical protein
MMTKSQAAVLGNYLFEIAGHKRLVCGTEPVPAPSSAEYVSGLGGSIRCRLHERSCDRRAASDEPRRPNLADFSYKY